MFPISERGIVGSSVASGGSQSAVEGDPTGAAIPGTATPGAAWRSVEKLGKMKKKLKQAFAQNDPAGALAPSPTKCRDKPRQPPSSSEASLPSEGLLRRFSLPHSPECAADEKAATSMSQANTICKSDSKNFTYF